MNYTIHRIRPGYWIIRNLYRETLAECHNATQARLIIRMLTE